jgi:DNA helicase HerA-like ATPase
MGIQDRIVAAITAGDAMELGRVMEIAGAGAQVSLDGHMMALVRRENGLGAPPGTIGSHVKMRVGNRWVLGQIRTLRLAQADSDLVLGMIDFVGEGADLNDRLTSFRRGVTLLPMPGAALHAVAEDELITIFAPDERPHIEIGTVYPSGQIPATLSIDGLLGRHFAILGSTGTGKSSAMALMLHRVGDFAAHGHIVMIDPHGEYAASFKEKGAIFDVSNLAIPYWLMNLDEHAEILLTSSGAERQIDRDVLAKCILAARAKNRAAEGLTRLTVDSPVPYLLSDLGAILAAEMGRLDKGGLGSAPYMRIKARVDEIKADPRYAFMFSGMLVADSMADVLSRMLRLPGNGKPIAIVDLSGVPSEVTAVVVALLARLIFDHAVWSRGPDQRPVLLICEEAHRYIPAGSTAPARAMLERIAKEGRKYGISLGLVTQRPSDLAEGVLSQCGTIIAMRLNNERDQQFVRSAVPEGARGLIDMIPALRNREAIMVGEGVPIPIRIAFDPLEAHQLPASHDPVFSAAWKEAADDDRVRLDRTIKRWRAQGR